MKHNTNGAVTAAAPAATITGGEYGTLDQAYDFFNAELFAGKLPLVLITLNRKAANNLGYFSPERFSSRTSDDSTDEIALNPDNFTGRSDKDILSTLVHEMAHVWQHHFGKSSRNGYHNKEWGAEMDRIGLEPSNTGQPGGKRTGQQMMHIITPGGAFELACDALLGTGAQLNWQSVSRNGAGAAGPLDPDDEPAEPKSKNKIKYTCPGCGANVWGKPELNIVCGDCTPEPGDPVLFVSQD